METNRRYNIMEVFPPPSPFFTPLTPPIFPLLPLSHSHSSPTELPSIAVTYRDPPERYAASHSSSMSPRPVRDNKEGHRLHHTINRTLMSILHRGRPHSPGSSGGRHRATFHSTSDRGHRAQNREQEGGTGGSRSMGKQSGFQSYGKMQDHEDREETSSGSSSHSGSPGGERGRGGSEENLPELGREEEDEEDEDDEDLEDGKVVKNHSKRIIRQVFSGGERDMITELSSSHSSQGTLVGSGGGDSSVGGGGASNPSSKRSDSLGRGLKYPHYQLKRYPSNDSMSSQSTLVPKLNYEPDDSIVDIMRLSTGHGLTQSNVQDHVKSEANKHKHKSYHRTHQQHHHHHRHRPRQREEEEEEEGEGDMDGEEVYGYEKGKDKFMEERQQETVVASSGRGRGRGRGRDRDDRKEGPGRRQPRVDVNVVDDDDEGVCLHVHTFPPHASVTLD